MASLYEIDGMVLTVLENGLVFDEETGEILFDEDNFAQLEMERNAKLEAVACYVKGLEAEAAAIRAEEKALAARRHVKEAKAKRLRDYLTRSMEMMGDTKLETARVALSFRKSEAVEFDERLLSDEWFVVVHSADKVGIKRALKAGIHVAGAELVERRNLQIK